MGDLHDLYFIRHPHLFKPMQSLNAVILLICLGSSSYVDGKGVLWFVTMLSLFISTVATVIFMMDKNDEVIAQITGGIMSWNALEFVYSSILTVLCGISFWLGFGYASHVSVDGHAAGFVFYGVFMIIQMVLYAIPLLLIYENIRASENIARDNIQPFGAAVVDVEERRYQTGEQIV